MNNNIVRVNLTEQNSNNDRSYPIVIENGLLQNGKDLQSYFSNQQLCFVSNTTIAPLYLNSIIQLLKTQFPKKKITQLILPDGEQHKNLTTVSHIFDKLIEEKFDRSMALCALGGGVIGDMTGFAAACYRRGVDFIQIPTTLLAQVDASVGGKTAVNHPLGKNMIGAFYQPKAVLIDPTTLKTLPEREYRAGLAEVIKYGLIKDKNFFYELQQHQDEIITRDVEYLALMIKLCCTIKAEIVSIDEREAGERALLNFGHTFAHAIETATNYCIYLHGEAVAIGMVAAGYISYKLNHISQGEFQNINQVLQQFNLPTRLQHPLSINSLKDAMTQDKKILESTTRLILLRSVGFAYIDSDCPETLIDEALKAIGAVS